MNLIEKRSVGRQKYSYGVARFQTLGSSSHGTVESWGTLDRLSQLDFSMVPPTNCITAETKVRRLVRFCFTSDPTLLNSK